MSAYRFFFLADITMPSPPQSPQPGRAVQMSFGCSASSCAFLKSWNSATTSSEKNVITCNYNAHKYNWLHVRMKCKPAANASAMVNCWSSSSSTISGFSDDFRKLSMTWEESLEILTWNQRVLKTRHTHARSFIQNSEITAALVVLDAVGVCFSGEGGFSSLLELSGSNQSPENDANKILLIFWTMFFEHVVCKTSGNDMGETFKVRQSVAAFRRWINLFFIICFIATTFFLFFALSIV